MIAALLAAVELFAGVTVAGASGKTAAGSAGFETARPSCEMTCCRVQVCECKAAPVKTPAPPAPAVPLVQPLEYRLAPAPPATDLLSVTLEALKEPKAPAPSTEVVLHAAEAPLFALHCSWLI